MDDKENAKLNSAIAILRSLADPNQAVAPKTAAPRNVELAAIAKAYRSTVLVRERTVGSFAPLNPGWRILLELYILESENVKVAVSDVSLFTNIASTTSLRYITLLSEEHFIERIPCVIDRRRFFIQLTSKARNKVESFFEALWNEMYQLTLLEKQVSSGNGGLQNA